MPERSQKLPHKQSCDWLGSVLIGLEVPSEGPTQTNSAQRVLCQKRFPVSYTTSGGVLDNFFSFLVNMIQCLIINYFTKL